MDGNKRRGLLRHKHWDKRPLTPSGAKLVPRAGAVATEAARARQAAKGGLGARARQRRASRPGRGGDPGEGASEPGRRTGQGQQGQQGQLRAAGPGPAILPGRQTGGPGGQAAKGPPPGDATEHGPLPEAGREGQRRAGQRGKPSLREGKAGTSWTEPALSTRSRGAGRTECE